MNSEHYGSKQFQQELDVSRETIADLCAYEALIKKWTPSINLIAKSTIPNLWERHFRDSAQVMDHIDAKGGKWVDVGSGGGLPALVIAIIAKHQRPGLKFTLVESDRRKTVFLETVVRKLSIPAEILCNRIETLNYLAADIFSARAIAPLNKLLGYANLHIKPGGKAVLMKGASFQEEIDAAKEFWGFQYQNYPSITDPNAAILCIGEIERV
jgi:16S rRNA (guanine527-N7)-methyltransferase